MTDPDDDLLFQQTGDVGVITFNREQARNALTFEMYDQLGTLCEKISASTISIKALIITGAGEKAFAAGTDISRFRTFKTDADALGYERQMDQVLGSLESLSIPTVAAVRGVCTGGGAAIAACCDLRIANADLKFGFPIARTLGNCLSVGNLSRLVELLGVNRTREILLTSRLIQIDEALHIALVNEVVEDPITRAKELCDILIHQAPRTIAATKEGLRRLREHAANVAGDDLILSCYVSDDFHEGIDAFLSKRKPHWTGR